MNVRWTEHYAKMIRPIHGAYLKYTCSLSDETSRGVNQPRWRGVRVTKLPNDLIMYAEAIWENRPDFIIEAGTRFGGSAAFFGDMLMLSGGKKVFTIDTEPQVRVDPHPMVEFITGSSTDPEIFKYLQDQVSGNGSVMVSLDSDHRTKHVAKELELYSQLTTIDQYLVVEDCWSYHPEPRGPYQAVEDFLARHPQYARIPVENKYIFAISRDGWLRRKR